MAVRNSRGTPQDIQTLLSSAERDFLIRSNGDQVSIRELVAKIICFYFSGLRCGPCRRFNPILCEVYKELSLGGDFEVIVVPSDETEESFNEFFSTSPWLAIPFSDEATTKSLKEMFGVKTIPHLVILDKTGNVLTRQGLSLVRAYGADAYPFTAERMDSLIRKEEDEKENQSLISLLASKSRDYLVTNKGNKVPVAELEGKTVGLYFSIHGHRTCNEFVQKLIDYYTKLRETTADFEIVVVPLDYEEKEKFRQGFDTMPWLAVPYGDKSCHKLSRYFECSTLPMLAIIGPDGKTFNRNVVELIQEHGNEAYPFTAYKLLVLGAVTKARMAAQTLESVLTMGEHDFVIDQTGTKIAIPQLAGKNILLYFSAHWCPPCRAFLPKLIEVYNEIKEDSAFEVIFISRDHDQASFDDYYSSMPWLALPYGDPRKSSLLEKFKISGIPSAVVINPNGQTVTKEARALITVYGVAAYPFTEDHLKPLKEALEEKAKNWPEKLRHEIHGQHELVRTHRSIFMCGECRETGFGWSFHCKPCSFDLHPSCCLKMDEEASENDGDP